MESFSGRAIEYLSASRLDIVGKIPLAQAIVGSREDFWARELFHECLLSMSPTGNFSEDGTKFTLFDYEAHFRELIESMMRNGYDSSISRVDIASDGTVWNGAHRIAAAHVMDLSVDSVFTGETPQVYDWHYFVRSGMPRIYLDSLAGIFTKHVQKTRGFVLSGLTGEETKMAKRSLAKMAPLVFEKTIHLTEIGIRRNLELMYGHLDWYEPALLEQLVRERFSSSDYAASTLLLYELPSSMSPRDIKENLRRDLGKHHFIRQIHGTDDWEETKSLAEVWTNSNSLKFLNETPIGSETRLLDRLSILDSENAAQKDHYVIDAGASLELHGVRVTDDIDHICLGDEHSQLELLGDCHREDYLQLGTSLTNVVYSPREHLIWAGRKFTTLDVEFRRLRNSQSSKHKQDFETFLDSPRVRKQSPVYQDSERASRARAWRIKSVFQVRIDRFLAALPPSVRSRVARMGNFIRALKNQSD